MGTDHIPPTALHTELEALVEAGLSSLEAITAATSDAARVLGLVILDADPLTDIRNTRSIHMVIQGGRIVDREALLERVRARLTTEERIGN